MNGAVAVTCGERGGGGGGGDGDSFCCCHGTTFEKEHITYVEMRN